MQTAPPSRIMLGGAVLNPDSAIPRHLSVCGGAIRFNDPGNQSGLTRRSLELLLKFCDLSPDAPQEFLPRSGPPTGGTSRSSFRVQHALQRTAGPYTRVISGRKRGPSRIGRCARLQIGFCKGYRARSGRGTKKRRYPFGPLIAGCCNAGHGQRELIFNSRGRYPLAWRWFGRLPR
jgi:hypothetical protein